VVPISTSRGNTKKRKADNKSILNWGQSRTEMQVQKIRLRGQRKRKEKAPGKQANHVSKRSG